MQFSRCGAWQLLARLLGHFGLGSGLETHKSATHKSTLCLALSVENPISPGLGVGVGVGVGCGGTDEPNTKVPYEGRRLCVCVCVCVCLPLSLSWIT